MTFEHGRPMPAPETGVIVAQPTVPISNPVAVVVGGILTVVGVMMVTGPLVARVVGLMVTALGLLIASAPWTVRNDGLTKRFTGWHQPTLEITPWPLPMGSPATVVYRRKPARTGTVDTVSGGPNVEAELVCQEWVRYTVGSSTTTDTEDVVRIRASTPTSVVNSGIGANNGTEIVASFELTVPVDVGGPTLSLNNNRVSWWLETRLGEPFGRKTSAKIDLVVPPVIDRNAVLGEAGSEGRR